MVVEGDIVNPRNLYPLQEYVNPIRSMEIVILYNVDDRLGIERERLEMCEQTQECHRLTASLRLYDGVAHIRYKMAGALSLRSIEETGEVDPLGIHRLD